MIGILDYGVGNIQAFKNVYADLSIPCKAVVNVEDFVDVTHIILPGVGSYRKAMKNIHDNGFFDKIIDSDNLEHGGTTLWYLNNINTILVKRDKKWVCDNDFPTTPVSSRMYCLPSNKSFPYFTRVDTRVRVLKSCKTAAEPRVKGR